MPAIAPDDLAVLLVIVANLIEGTERGVQRRERGEEDFHVFNLQRHVLLVGNLTLPGDTRATDVGVEAATNHEDVFRILEEVTRGTSGGEQSDLTSAGNDALGGGVEWRHRTEGRTHVNCLLRHSGKGGGDESRCRGGCHLRWHAIGDHAGDELRLGQGTSGADDDGRIDRAGGSDRTD